MPRETKEGVSFAKQVPAAASGSLKFKLEEPAVVGPVDVRIYTGAENTLDLEVLVEDPDEENSRPMVRTVGKDVIDGDDDTYHWDVEQELEENDWIVITYNNTDGSNAHNFRANISIDYATGGERITRKLRRWL